MKINSDQIAGVIDWINTEIEKEQATKNTFYSNGVLEEETAADIRIGVYEKVRAYIETNVR